MPKTEDGGPPPPCISEHLKKLKLFDHGLKLDISSYPHMNIRMGTKGKRPMRSLTPGDKIHAIQRIHDGESKASVARDIGVPESTLRGWCKNEDKLRFMSRQSAADKMSAGALSEKLDCASVLLGGPPEKRLKMDSSLPLNYSGKMKYDELAYKRSSLNDLDFGHSKTLTDLGFNGLASGYTGFGGTCKNKGFGADISRQSDPSMAAISPLSSLSHLSGLTGLSHSPLAISFNELTSNLSLLAQLNPSLAAMSGLNGLASSSTNQLRSAKPKTHSPRNEGGERQQGLSTKNWAKQKPNVSSSNELNFGLNLSQHDAGGKMKCQNPSLASAVGSSLPMTGLQDDPLLCWLKSQQAMLGLNGLYPPPPPPIGASSPPVRSSTPQQMPHAATPLTPSSTPSVGFEDKNSAWFNWCKAFGASLNSLAPAAAAMHPLPQPATSTTMESSKTASASSGHKAPFENILYSQLIKDTGSSSVHSTSSGENLREVTSNTDPAGKAEDLSAKPAKTASPAPSRVPSPMQSPDSKSQTRGSDRSPLRSPGGRSEAGAETGATENEAGGPADDKEVLENLLLKISNNKSNRTLDSSAGSSANTASVETASELDASESDSGDSLHNNNDMSVTNSNNNNNNNNNNSNNNSNNNNNNSNKTDEEERSRYEAQSSCGSDDQEAITHGEKFLKWLENCSNPRVTAMQLTQLRLLISAVKSEIGADNDQKATDAECSSIPATSTDAAPEEAPEEGGRCKLRRRK